VIAGSQVIYGLWTPKSLANCNTFNNSYSMYLNSFFLGEVGRFHRTVKGGSMAQKKLKTAPLYLSVEQVRLCEQK
jgi:hypothetical protein